MPRFHLPFRRARRYRKRSNIRMTLLLIFAIAACFLILPIYIVYKPPNSLIRYFQYRWPDVLWQVPTHEKLVALTIDDAPSEFTAEILQLLQQYHATATFFVIGSQASGSEVILADIIRGGNELGNHAMHDEPSRSLSDEELGNEIRQVQDYISKAYALADTIQPSRRFFRPGSGFFSTRMRATVSSLGYQLVLGSIYPHDPQIPYWSINARHVLSMISPGGIIICHDRRSWTAPMLKHVLSELKSRGYRVVSVTELLKQKER